MVVNQALLVGLILHVLYKTKQEGKTATLSHIDALLSDVTRDIGEVWAEMTVFAHNNDQEDGVHPVVSAAAKDMLDRPPEEAGSVLSSLKSYLSLYRDPVVGKTCARSDFRIRDLMHHESPVSLYIVTHPNDKARLRPLIRIMLNMIVRVLADKISFVQGKPVPHYRHRLLLMLDEFPSLGRLEILQESLAFLAGYGIKAYLICQDINQLKRFERSVKLARFNEDRVYANPHSTQEEMNAAIDQRVHAEAAAQLYHDTMMGHSMNNDTHKTQTGKTVEIPLETNQSLDTAATQRLYLVVPYIEKGQAKMAGARWDRVSKSWYVDRSKVDVSKVQKWLPKNAVNIAIHTPQEQFTQFLITSGAYIDNQHIIMNGKKHRIRVPGDKGREKSGVYIGYLDGKPAGYFKNFRTSVEMRWKSDTVQLSDQQKQALIEQVEEKLKLRHELEYQIQQSSAKAIEEFLQYTQLACETGHAYLALKNVRGGDLRVVANEQKVYADSLVHIARDRKEAKQLRDQNPDSLVLTLGDLLIPVQDIDGAIWGVQIIQADGTKFFSKHTRKEQNFHIVGCEQSQLNALKHAKAIVIAEGYATADTLSQAIGWPVVMAFDSGNLPAVAQVLKEQFPDKPFIIAGDDDYQLETKGEVNVGKQKALEAAKLVDGIAVFPIFAPEEQSREHLNDFNDLANKSILGMDAVKKQVGCVIDQVSQQVTQTNLQIVQKRAETVVARR